MIPIADQPMHWLCATCGKRPWAHAEHCACGAERPPPPVPPTPDPNQVQPDLPPLTGAWDDGSSAAEPWRLLP